MQFMLTTGRVMTAASTAEDAAGPEIVHHYKTWRVPSAPVQPRGAQRWGCRSGRAPQAPVGGYEGVAMVSLSIAARCVPLQQGPGPAYSL